MAVSLTVGLISSLRLWRLLLGDEGYAIHTLPVQP